MRILKPAMNWKHRKLYDKFIEKGRKSITKNFEDIFSRDSCRVSLVRLKSRRNEVFLIHQKGLSITITDKKENNE
jgi:hypothetical protein